MAVIYLPMTKLIVVLSTIHRNVLWHSNRFQLIIYEKLLILLLFEKLMHGYTGWSWNRLNVFVTVHLAGHCIELSLNPFLWAPTLSTPELTVFARVDLVTVVSSLSRDGIGVPLGSHPPRLLVAFLLLKWRLHTLLDHVRSYCRPRASEIGVWSLTQFDCVGFDFS